MANYLINMDDGRLVFRNGETDTQVNLRPVSDDIVKMIIGGEVLAMDVVNAISAKVKENGDFNLQQYIEDMKKLNVRKSNRQEAPEREVLKDRSGEEVSADDVKNVASKTSKKTRIKKVNDALDENTGLPDMFK